MQCNALSKSQIALLPSGATSNEPLHAEINSWTRVNREFHRSTLRLKLNIMCFGKQLGHHIATFYPRARQTPDGLCLKAMTSSHQPTGDEPQPNNSSGRQNARQAGRQEGRKEGSKQGRRRGRKERKKERKEINSWTRVNRAFHRSTLHLKLNIMCFGEQLGHRIATFYPHARQTPDGLCLKVMISSHQPTCDEPQPCISSGRQNADHSRQAGRQEGRKEARKEEKKEI